MLLCISLNHHGSSLPLLERASRHTEEVAAAFAAFAPGSVLLATCNRFELYVDEPERFGDDAAAFADAALRRLSDTIEVPAAELAAAATVETDRGAAAHLFAVTSGLESAALGEEEIAGQVRRAHAQARAEHTITDGLERLFQSATRTSRTVRERTGLRSAGQSLVRLALVLAERRVPSWDEATVLLVGTGAYAGATVAALRDRGAHRIRVHSPSGRAEAFAASHGLDPVAADEVAEALAGADLVVACSLVQEPLLHAADFAGETDRTRLVLDLGMPRNIDPGVAEVPGVELLDIESISVHSSIPELSAKDEARILVDAAAAEFTTTQAERIIGPTLASLRGHVLSILEDELCRARRGTAEPHADDVETALRRFTGRLLHEPTARLRALARDGRAAEAQAAAHALFGVEG
ncbi:glutamyl-tRNA reductase [Leucobacter luti]|uniref:Glutamyl-tRNA reductase n=1 Tax=Leucobacter luti TaxID=340320 RepID=A0A4V6MCV6_9MICO|nr:glutamyl-tRNA reductase [Leucobacter luti]MBL3698525.1 glutamyl-tRNA reductase [Leucobacter luti]RZT65899.1 glutamyl-tRNA reductase [Leucobacter luti]